MTAMLYLVPISLILGGIGLAAFFWTVRNDQYDDAKGNSMRVLDDEYDDHPKQ
ncbi:MAG: cbb3-type cytochrome oxidase assembly protein CcoS [Rhodobacteraceae bacterium]|nr:cbb3-type cytochrome oxidase assembly protein CcoS [Paracoccaceae bacterium]